MKLCGLVPNFLIHVYVSDLYIPTIGQNRQTDRSQIHECRNWERDRAVSFLRIFVSIFRCTVFAMQPGLASFRSFILRVYLSAVFPDIKTNKTTIRQTIKTRHKKRERSNAYNKYVVKNRNRSEWSEEDVKI
jgi:hypothetical protein